VIARRREKRTLGSARVLAGFILYTTLAIACADYQADTAATYSIRSVRVTTSAAEVASCRLIQRVDSRDSTLGCGLTVQPTPEECLRYQVRRVGGDTLLIRGPAGEAYACEAPAPSPAAPAPTSAPVAVSSTPPPAAVVPVPTSTPAPAPAPAPKPVPAPASVRLTADRDAARGCVYLGELAASTACDVSGETASGDCAAQALRAGGDLIVRDAGRGSIFACKARP